MPYYIKNYCLGARMAVVGQVGSPEVPPEEMLVIQNGRITFSSDHSEVELDEKTQERLSELHIGDIVNINEKGICYRLFDSHVADATIFMGGNCNSNCTMCPSSDYERNTGSFENREELFKLIDMLPRTLSHYVVTGGEPTMKKELFLEVTERLAIQVPEANALLLTNGRSFSSLTFLDRLLIKCPPYLVAAVPIHGSCSEIHDAVTRAEGSFRQTVKGIKNLMSRGISVEIRVVVTKMNCDDLEQIAELISKQFPSCLCVNFIGLEVRGNCVVNQDMVYLAPDQSFQKSKTAIKHLIRQGIDVGLYNYPLCCVERGYWFLCRKSISPEKVRYDTVCDGCDMKEECGGIFISTLNTMHPNVTPITFPIKERDKQC